MIYRFGRFELDEYKRELRFERRIVLIEPKVFDLLDFLLRNRRRAVTRGELHAAIWPDTQVGPDSLSRIVKEARRILGDRADQQLVIKTLRGLGYRFVAAVEAEHAAGPDGEAEQLLRDAQSGLEAALRKGTRDLESQIRRFVLSCRLAISIARDRDSSLR